VAVIDDVPDNDNSLAGLSICKHAEARTAVPEAEKRFKVESWSKMSLRWMSWVALSCGPEDPAG